MRPFLIYLAAPKDVYQAELFGKDRAFDVAYNDYTETHTIPEQAEYKLSINEWKYECFKRHLSHTVSKYQAVALLDDDIQASTQRLNELFQFGLQHNFNIWHPTYGPETREECQVWDHIRQRPNSQYRPTNTVDLSAPFFSQYALNKCLHTFDYNCSGVGLEIVWFHLLQPNPKHMMIDVYPVTHTRRAKMLDGGKDYPPYPNGLTWDQELHLVLRRTGLKQKMGKEDVW